MDSDFDFQTPSTPRRKPKAPAKPETRQPFVPPDEVEVAPETDEVKKEETKAPKYDPDDLAAIFDEIIFSGEYTESQTIRGKLNVVFRTRTAEELKEINRIVDGTQAVFANTLDGVRSLLQLQYALIMYQGKDLRGMKPEDRSKFIGKIPGPIIGALLMALGRFDDKVFAACKEGEENF